MQAIENVKPYII